MGLHPRYTLFCELQELNNVGARNQILTIDGDKCSQRNH
jgi:hypothetical protein